MFRLSHAHLSRFEGLQAAPHGPLEDLLHLIVIPVDVEMTPTVSVPVLEITDKWEMVSDVKLVLRELYIINISTERSLKQHPKSCVFPFLCIWSPLSLFFYVIYVVRNCVDENAHLFPALVQMLLQQVVRVYILSLPHASKILKHFKAH